MQPDTHRSEKGAIVLEDVCMYNSTHPHVGPPRIGSLQLKLISDIFS